VGRDHLERLTKEKTMKWLAAFLLGAFVKVFLGGWIVMITAGMVHHEVSVPSVPAYGFRESAFLAIGLTVLGSFFQNAPSSRD
jgi:hypothetical protein